VEIRKSDGYSPASAYACTLEPSRVGDRQLWGIFSATISATLAGAADVYVSPVKHNR